MRGEELGWSLTPRSGGLPGLPHHNKPARKGGGEGPSNYPPCPMGVPRKLQKVLSEVVVEPIPEQRRQCSYTDASCDLSRWKSKRIRRAAKHPIGLEVPSCKRATPDAAYPRRSHQLLLTRIPKQRTLCNSHAHILVLPRYGSLPIAECLIGVPSPRFSQGKGVSGMGTSRKGASWLQSSPAQISKINKSCGRSLKYSFTSAV